MLTHVMLDLETLGVSPYSMIIAIGACAFDPDEVLRSEVVTNRFEVAIDPVSCQGLLRTDATTLMWWMDAERDAARAIWLKMPKVALREALDGFTDWLNSLRPGLSTDLHVRMWGNGAGFDNVLLRQAYEVTAREPPWSFRHDRCFRTLRSLLIFEEGHYLGTQHTALADAENQAIRANQIVRRLNIKLT